MTQEPSKFKEPNKIRILKTLLESPKITGDIAIDLGYVHKKEVEKTVKINGKKIVKIISKNVIEFNNVMPSLRLLEKEGNIHRFIVGEKTFGAHPSNYDIVYNINNIKTILEEYPSLISDLKKNDQVIELILDEHKWISDAYCETKKLDLAKLPDSLKDDPDFASILNLVEMKKPFHDDLKEKLQTSASFFRLFVNNSSDALKHNSMKILALEIKTKSMDFFELERKTKSLKPKSNLMISSFLDIIYESCVISDILNGESCDEGYQYIFDMKKLKLRDEYPY
jgi:hypothetical protein